MAATMLTAAPAFAERVLSLDEAPVGEIDPAKATDYADTVLMINVYDTLVFPKKGAPGVDPLLATEWETDGKTYTFKLKDGVKFHSGNPLTAEDVVFSYNRLIALGQGFSSLFVDKVEKVEAVDPLTVKFTLKEAYAPFLASLVRLQVVELEDGRQPTRRTASTASSATMARSISPPRTPAPAPTSSRARTRSPRR